MQQCSPGKLSVSHPAPESVVDHDCKEFILLSDILGLSLLVDSIDHPKPPESTEGTLLGPFHSHEAEAMQNGALVSHDTNGETCLVFGSVKDGDGQPISGVRIDVWETDSTGHYDLQNDQTQGPDGRAVLESDADGRFWFKAIVPVSYPIPSDGPVGNLLALLGRHPWRPAHMHFIFEKVGYDHLITALYVRGDPYETTDAVFGVKESLLVQFSPASDAIAAQHGVKVGTPLLKYDFVLVSEAEASQLRSDRSVKALHDLGRKVKIVDGLPVPEVD